MISLIINNVKAKGTVKIETGDEAKYLLNINENEFEIPIKPEYYGNINYFYICKAIEFTNETGYHALLKQFENKKIDYLFAAYIRNTLGNIIKKENILFDKSIMKINNKTLRFFLYIIDILLESYNIENTDDIIKLLLEANLEYYDIRETKIYKDITPKKLIELFIKNTEIPFENFINLFECNNEEINSIEIYKFNEEEIKRMIIEIFEFSKTKDYLTAGSYYRKIKFLINITIRCCDKINCFKVDKFVQGICDTKNQNDIILKMLFGRYLKNANLLYEGVEDVIHLSLKKKISNSYKNQYYQDISNIILSGNNKAYKRKVLDKLINSPKSYIKYSYVTAYLIGKFYVRFKSNRYNDYVGNIILNKDRYITLDYNRLLNSSFDLNSNINEEYINQLAIEKIEEITIINLEDGSNSYYWKGLLNKKYPWLIKWFIKQDKKTLFYLIKKYNIYEVDDEYFLKNILNPLRYLELLVKNLKSIRKSKRLIENTISIINIYNIDINKVLKIFKNNNVTVQDAKEILESVNEETIEKYFENNL